MPCSSWPAALLLAIALGGCGNPRREAAPAPARHPVSVRSDTGLSVRLHVLPPEVGRVWMTRVARTRPAPVSPVPHPPELDLPSPAIETLKVETQRASTGVAPDHELKPPILRASATRAPSSLHGVNLRPGSVELDVRVDERGDVSDALWAGGSHDSALVRAATECTRAMRFYPALMAGRPLAVWCRQRFEFGRP